MWCFVVMAVMVMGAGAEKKGGYAASDGGIIIRPVPSPDYHHSYYEDNAPVSYAPSPYAPYTPYSSEAHYPVPHEEPYGEYAPSHYGHKSKLILKGHKGHKGYIVHKGHKGHHKAPKVKVIDKENMKNNMNLLHLKKKYKLENMLSKSIAKLHNKMIKSAAKYMTVDEGGYAAPAPNAPMTTYYRPAYHPPPGPQMVEVRVPKCQPTIRVPHSVTETLIKHSRVTVTKYKTVTRKVKEPQYVLNTVTATATVTEYAPYSPEPYAPPPYASEPTYATAATYGSHLDAKKIKSHFDAENIKSHFDAKKIFGSFYKGEKDKKEE